jgi:hypothetical protein
LRMRKKRVQIKYTINPPESPFECDNVLSNFINFQRGTRNVAVLQLVVRSLSPLGCRVAMKSD